MGRRTLRQSWAEGDRKYLLHGGVPLDTFAEKGSELIIEEGHGLILRDVYGKEYIDAISGAICVNLGYGRDELPEVAMAQMKKLSYLMSWSNFAATATIEYAEKLAEFTPKGLGRFFFANSGSEANESAYKIARFYWINQRKGSKIKIISRQHSYHGLNLASMSATGMERFHERFGPLVPGFIRIPTAYCYRCPFGKEYPKCKLECAEVLAETIDKEGEDTVAAFVAEPIHGTAGTIVPPPEYLPRVRQICTERNVLFILDEVMTGFGRTGENFACEHWGVIPDMMLMSKGLINAALPLSAVAITEKVFDGMRGPNAFYHLYTCGAHPVCCAVAMKSLEILIREKLVENSAKVGKYMLKRLKELEESPYVGEVRGLGLFAGFEIVESKKTKVASTKLAREVVANCRKRGLIVRVAGTAIQVAPPLIATEADSDMIVDILKSVVFELKL
jgi:adenosylmethionine-8-amino-7-oxononanoate aminotransferase